MNILKHMKHLEYVTYIINAMEMLAIIFRINSKLVSLQDFHGLALLVFPSSYQLCSLTALVIFSFSSLGSSCPSLDRTFSCASHSSWSFLPSPHLLKNVYIILFFNNFNEGLIDIQTTSQFNVYKQLTGTYANICDKPQPQSR